MSTINAFSVKEIILSDFLNQKLVLPPDLFPSAITENITLENAVFLFVHYYGIICSCRDRNFDNNYGNFGVLYYECTSSSLMLDKFYLEVLCRIIFNSVTNKILPKLLFDYDANNFQNCQQRTICNKKLCPPVEIRKITSTGIKETAYFCLHILKLNQPCININFIKHIF